MDKLNEKVSFVVSEDEMELGYKIVDTTSDYESCVHYNKEDLCDLVSELLRERKMSYGNAFELFMNIIGLELPNLSSLNESSGYYRIYEEQSFLDRVAIICEEIENEIVSSRIVNFPGIGYFDELEGPFVRIYFKVKDASGEETKKVSEDISSLFQFEHELKRLIKEYNFTQAEVNKLQYEIKEVILPETADGDDDFKTLTEILKYQQS